MTKSAGADSRSARTGSQDRLVPMAMAGLIWICLLVVIVLVVAPLFGSWVALFSALVSLAIISVVCFTICSIGAIKD